MPRVGVVGRRPNSGGGGVHRLPSVRQIVYQWRLAAH